MTELTRRTAILGLAAGAAAAGTIGTSAAQASPASSDPAAQAAREAARRLVATADRFPGGPAREARVLLCRSWDNQIYLQVSDAVKGFVAVDDRAFAIAAACQAANRRVAVQYWGHSAEWAGAGRFEGVLLAMDLRDLPGNPDAAL
jgi:hypothetical protein